MDEYVTIAWSLASFIAGAGAGVWLTVKLSGTIAPKTATLRRGFQWARSDIHVMAPTAANTNLRKITDWQNAPELDTENRTLTFDIECRDGLRRTMTYSARQLFRLFRCDTPKHAEWHGNHNEFVKLMAVCKHYGWTIPGNKNGQEWSMVFGTRERRLRLLALMLTADESPPRAT